MKYLKLTALAFLFGAILSVAAYADGKPHSGGPGNPGPSFGMHYGLSDSCWNVFLSEISASDAAKLAADQQTITANNTQIDTLNKQIFALLINTKGRRDTTNRSAIQALQAQIQTLEQANGAAQMDIDTILKTNGSIFQAVADSCGKHDFHDHGGPPDTTKGPGPGNGNPNPPNIGSRVHFGLSDSCWNIFLTQLAPADASQLGADQTTISANQAQIDSLLKVIRSLKGNLKDSSVRAEIKGILSQINAIVKSSMTAEKDYASIIKKYDAILQSIRQDCGRPVHKGSAGDPSNGLLVSDIVPNPAMIGSSASLTITLTADAPVNISIGSAIAQGPPMKIIFSGTLTSGTHTEALDLTGYGSGVYLVYIQSGSVTVIKKLVIQ